jgi:hypothetical protein
MLLFTAILFSIILTYVFNQKINVILKFDSPSPRPLLLLIYVLSLLITLLSPGVDESVFVGLPSLGVANWLRALAGLLLGVFLPGFALISLSKHKLNPILLLPISVLLTMFINTTVAFIAIMLAQPALMWLLIMNTLIFSLSLIDALRDKTVRYSLKRIHNVSITFDNTDILMLLLCIFQLSILISVFFLSGLTVPNEDMWYHAFMATLAEKGELLRFGLLTYPPFFSVHLFSVSELAGLPAITTSNILGLTNMFLVLAFYELALTLTRKKAVAFLSTFTFTMFGSFTFLVQAVLGKMVADPQRLRNYFLQVSEKTMQSNSVYTLVNIYAYAPVTLHFLSVLVLTALLLQKDKGRVLYAVEALLIANLFLLHIAETMYVLIFLFAALMLDLSRIKDLVSLTLGVWLGAAVLSMLPFVRLDISLYVAVVYTAVLVFALLCMRLEPLPKLRGLFGKMLGVMSKTSLRVFFAFAILSLYGFLLLVWKVFYIDRDEYITGVLSYLGAAPTYFMPVAFGLPLVISVLYFAKCLVSKDLLDQNQKKVLTFLALAFALAYLFGKAITLANLSGYMIYRELRVLQVFGGILFSIVSGLALHEALKHFKYIKNNQKNILALGLGVLILLGSGSTFLSAVVWANRDIGAYPLNSNEVEALEFLKRTVNASDVVLTYSAQSNNKVGLTGATTINRFAVPFSSVSSSIPKDFLQLVSYIYLTKQDYSTIQKSDTYMKSLIPILPVIFNNTEIMIFSVPQIKSYMGDLSIPVVISGDLKEALPKLAILDSLGVNYRIYDTWDLRILAGSSTVILTDDVENASDAQKYVDWVQDGGHLIILGENEGYYSNLMNIQTRTKIVFQEARALYYAAPDVTTANGILCEYCHVPLDFKFNITSPKESLDKDVQVVSWYTLNDEKVAPLTFTKEVGSGKLIYVDSKFPTKVIPELSNFSKCFLKSIDPYLLNYTQENTEIKSLLPREIYGLRTEIYGAQSLNGNISIDSDTMYFWEHKNVTYSLELGNGTQLSLSANRLALYSPFKFTLSLNGSVTVQPLHDEYVEVLIPEGEEITIKFRHQENNALSCISNGDNIWCYDVALATINSNTPLTVTVKSPNITVNGVIRFQGAFFNIPYDKIIGTGLGALTIEGKMTYDILFSDKNADRSFGDNVFLDGSYRYDYPTIQEIELPIGLFMTDDFLIPVIVIFICSAFTVSLFSFGSKTNSAPTQGKQNKSTKNNVAMVKQHIKKNQG